MFDCNVHCRLFVIIYCLWGLGQRVKYLCMLYRNRFQWWMGKLASHHGSCHYPSSSSLPCLWSLLFLLLLSQLPVWAPVLVLPPWGLLAPWAFQIRGCAPNCSASCSASGLHALRPEPTVYSAAWCLHCSLTCFIVPSDFTSRIQAER